MAKKKRPGQRQRPGQSSPSQPQWRPIAFLPLIARHIDGMLEADREQYETLLEARPKPYVLDGFTVDRVIVAFTTRQQDFGLFDEQLRQWQALELSVDQRREVTRLVEQMRLLRENNEQVLALAKELQQGTIERVLSKSDAELGLEMLMRLSRE
ncbi:MAG: hypothetical protein J2P37_22790 [Ktedonobacteraceae bacterium]|nr:hypothetical protein [Ktedonobacteraceae bacterium]